MPDSANASLIVNSLVKSMRCFIIYTVTKHISLQLSSQESAKKDIGTKFRSMLCAAQDNLMDKTDSDGPVEQTGSGLRPAHWQQEVYAHCLCIDAQAAVAQQDWDTADAQLAKVSRNTQQRRCCACSSAPG